MITFETFEYYKQTEHPYCDLIVSLVTLPHTTKTGANMKGMNEMVNNHFNLSLKHNGFQV